MSTSVHPSPNAVLLDLAVRTKAEALEALAARAAALIERDPGEIARALVDRERLGSTGVGAGVALPHADLRGLREPLALFARLARPVDWEAIDDQPVDLVAVVLSPLDGVGPPLNLLARFARLLRVEGTRRRLMSCSTAEQVVDVLTDEDRSAAAPSRG